MKLYVAILALFIFKNAAFCQFWPKGGEYLHVGNINCVSKEQYLDSTKKAYHVAWQDRDIHNSRHIIDISLDLRAYPYEISARLYWDSTFTLYYTGYQDQNDGSICLLDTVFPPPDISIDSLFNKIVESGIFTLPYASAEDLAKSWKAVCIGKHGETQEYNNFNVSHGTEYVLTFKVNNCYGQHVFKHSDVYAIYYNDHPIFKRQVVIVDALLGAYYLKKQ